MAISSETSASGCFARKQKYAIHQHRIVCRLSDLKKLFFGQMVKRPALLRARLVLRAFPSHAPSLVCSPLYLWNLTEFEKKNCWWEIGEDATVCNLGV
jgi:hypothetical protein